MKLVLCSSFIDKKKQTEVEKFLGTKLLKMKVGFIPNAIKGDKSKHNFVEADFNEVKMIFGEVEMLDLNVVNEIELRRKLEEFEAIWVNGGLVSNLLEVFEKSGFSKVIREFLNMGLVYFGSSAGSMVCSETLNTSVWFIGEEEVENKGKRGLGLVSFEVYPHFREDLRDKILTLWAGGEELVLIKDGEVILVLDGKRIDGGELVNSVE